MNTLSMYGISNEYRELMAAIEDQGGELTPEQEEALAFNEENFVTKRESYVAMLNYYSQLAAVIKAKKAQIAEFQKSCEKIVDRLSTRLQEAMVTRECEEFFAGDNRVRLKKCPASVVIDDENAVPDNCKIIKVEISKTALADLLKAGGTDCGAHLENRIKIEIK